MSTGKQHELRNLVTIAILSFIIFMFIAVDYSQFYWLFWLPVGFVFTTFYASSDFDQERKHGFMAWYWRPFAKLVPHRSPLSHWPGLGTIIKDIYLTPVWIAIGFFVTGMLNISFEILIISNQKQIISFFVGQCLADGLHLIFDIESTFVKTTSNKLFKRGKYARN